MAMQRRDRSDTLTKLLVVEAFTPCPCHTAVTVRHPDRPYFIFLYVASPRDIGFGDTILVADPCDDSDYIEADFYLYRGPGLLYHLVVDDFPSELLLKLAEERIDISGQPSDDDTDHPTNQ
jgi:hypothetical protein